jgi:hypothetical protein
MLPNADAEEPMERLEDDTMILGSSTPTGRKRIPDNMKAHH